MTSGIAANVADRAMRRAIALDFAYWEELDDRWALVDPEGAADWAGSIADPEPRAPALDGGG